MGGEPKQFRMVAGVPLLLRAVRPFAQHPSVRQIIVALPAQVAAAPPDWLKSLTGDRLKLVAGGPTRAASVRAALQELNPECETVLVHDAARPFVAPETIDAVIRAAAETGAVPAIPVSDTVKRVDVGSARIVATVDRTGLWRAQTPQGFPRGMLEAGFRLADEQGYEAFTDESAMVEAAGFAVRIVPDSTRNLKITTESDLAVAELLAVQ
jgi:2-C-methyl-D-erythritol 4-phosphate cytidylyltransferase